MNLLTAPLPKTVIIAGKECPINTNFRISIQFELLMQDGDLEEQEKVTRAIKLYYPEMPENIQEACGQLIWFYRCGKDEDTGEGEDADPGDGKKVYDFEYDADYIYAAFLEQYGVDLTSIKYLHWWKFRAMFRALDDSCEFVKIMGYRGMRIPSKMPKEQKAFYRKMKRIYALPLPEGERQKNDAITQALMNGGDLRGLL